MYIFSILLLVVVFLLEPLILRFELSVFALLDLSTFVIIAVLVCGAMVAEGQLKNFGNAFKIAFTKKEYALAELKKAKNSINCFSIAVWGSAGFGFAYSVIATLNCIESREDAWVKFATALLFPLYACILFLLVMPIRARIQQKINGLCVGAKGSQLPTQKPGRSFIVFPIAAMILVFFFIYNFFTGYYATLGGTVDVPSLVMIVYVACGMLAAGKQFGNFLRVFSIAFAKKEFTFLELKNTESAVNDFIVASWIAAALSLAYSVICCFYCLEPSSMGPLVALAVCTMYYAAVLTLLVLPAKMKIKKLLSENDL